MNRKAAMRLMGKFQASLSLLVTPLVFARPAEACDPSSNEIQRIRRELAHWNPDPEAPFIRLVPEALPPGIPSGWRAFRFTSPTHVIDGRVCGVASIKGRPVFVMDVHSGISAMTMRQKEDALQQSHILVVPNGYVAPELIVHG